MNRTALLALALAALTVLVGGRSLEAGGDAHLERSWDGKRLVAHEWGTFTSVQGSDGVVLDGLQHEETDLPSFVYDLRDRAGITGVSPKMETPVIYFYAPTPRRVRVDVRFPRGTITQWYPAAHHVNHQGRTVNGVPSKPDGRTIARHENGYIGWGRWGDLEVLARDAEVTFPPVSADDPWRFCRETDANALKVCTLNTELDSGGTRRLAYEHERCLFYRGLGDFPLPFRGRVLRERAGAHEYEVALELENTTPAEPLTHLFLVWVGPDRAGFHYVPELRAEKELDVTLTLYPKARATEMLVQALSRRLVETGLYGREALAMARTWQQGYFQDEGLRALYVLPTAYVERELPLRIGSIREHDEDEWQVVRTFVGRTELLSPQREREIQTAVQTLVVEDAPGRDVAEAALRRYGRFALPYLARASALADSAELKRRIEGAIQALALKR